MIYVLSFIFVLGLIILVHELGHFLGARAVGIRVDRFSIGFGPKIAAIQRGETEYRISYVPLGGYVKMAGMIDESLESPDSFDPNDPHLFMNRKAWQKVVAVCAGVAMNMILAAFVLWGVYAIRGRPIAPDHIGTVIDRPIHKYPAEKAGLQRGDRILAVDGVEVGTWEDLVRELVRKPGQEVRLDYERGGERRSLTLITKSERLPVSLWRGVGTWVRQILGRPIREEPTGPSAVGKIGIGALIEFKYERVGIGQAFVDSWVGTWWIVRQTAAGIWKLVRGQASVKELMGPVGIAKMTGETARHGFGELLELLALISANIGFLNILPIPALDGGHLVMVGVEAVRRRPLSTKVKLWIQQVGMMLLLVLIAVVLFNDVMKLR